MKAVVAQAIPMAHRINAGRILKAKQTLDFTEILKKNVPIYAYLKKVSDWLTPTSVMGGSAISLNVSDSIFCMSPVSLIHIRLWSIGSLKIKSHHI